MMSQFKRYLIFAIGACCLLASCKPRTYRAYNTFGPIQAIGSQEKLYVFLEIDRIVSSGKTYYDAPGAYPVGHKQELLIFDQNGLSERIPIKTNNNVDGVSFHPNLMTLFAYDEKIFGFSGESYGHKDSVFLWDSEKSKFVLLTFEEGQALLNKFSVNGSVPSRADMLRKVSLNSGWNFHYENSSLEKEELKWNENLIHISTSINGENLEVLISKGDATSNPAKTLSYPIHRKTIDAKQFDGLSREDHGHPK